MNGLRKICNYEPRKKRILSSKKRTIWLIDNLWRNLTRTKNNWNRFNQLNIFEFCNFSIICFLLIFVSVFTVEWFPEETNQKQHLISFIIFLIIAVLTLLIGVICGFLWYRSHDSFKGTIKTIKQRLKEEIKENPNDDESVDIEVVEK